ncbi:RidA family protein [Sphingomonas sp. SM33]|uniref:RidA family protein n=1 Tax=Sphingomonas telluris TaxID=2907998 RepID=A0ABS9VR79_9SPHN|nr:RidA family protein [Sphingomonas telluris]MCH8617471.1 RidA family protein [Sphingomonas telluris]
MSDRPPEPVGLYEPFTRLGPVVFVSAISSARDGQLITGKVGADIDFAHAQAAATRAAENLLSVIVDAAERDPSRIKKILLLRGYVNATEDFAQVHKVVDAASEFLIEKLGEKGRHARTSLGCATLPNGNTVTLEAVVLLK